MKKQAYEDAKVEGRALGLAGAELDAMASDRARIKSLEMEAEMERLQESMEGDA